MAKRNINITKHIIITALSILLIAVFTGCGGGITITPNPNPNPNPGVQQSPTPDVSKIWAGYDTSILTIGVFVIRGEPGAMEPGATIHYNDGAGHNTQGPAGGDGSFVMDNMPGAFDCSVGNTLYISQTIAGHEKSDMVQVVIAAP